MSVEEVKATAKVVDMPTRPKRKAKIDIVVPTDIVEVWRLVEHSIRAGSLSYPDVTEDQPEIIRAHLFNYLQQPLFHGLIARFNRRPVGLVLGNIGMRAFGRPSKYAFIYCFWVEPGFRGQGVAHALLEQYFSRMKKIGIFSWEAQASEQLSRELVREGGVPVLRLMQVIGGKM
jgi:ribosomal protein S18 acetylase RimI-like enzyme